MSSGIWPDQRQPIAERRGRLALSVLDDLVELVVSGALPPGSTFPSEVEIGQRYGVSRTVVRESMRSLEERGLAEIRQGQGTTVSPVERWNLLDPVVLDAAIRNDEKLATLDDLVAVRDALESQMAADAAARIDDAELAELKAMVATLEADLGDPAQYAIDDVRFHDIVMRASRNALAKSIVNSVHPHARASNRYTGRTESVDQAATQAAHVAIYERIAAHDSEGAREAMHEHIISSWLRRRVSASREFR